MNIATAITEVVTFEASPEELSNRDLILEKIKKQKPITFGSDVLGDYGIKVHFIGEPSFFQLHDTLVKCTIRAKLTINKELADMLGMPTEINRTFTGYSKCFAGDDTSKGDVENYDFEFAKKITMNKAKVNAYSYFQKRFIQKITTMQTNMVKVVGFCKKMEALINGNIKYITNTCNAMYPEYPDSAETEEIDKDIK